MNDESYRKEYIMADSGLIWRGSHNRMRPCPWNFAQFEKDILECSIYLLSSIGKLTVAGRADPVRVARAISAAVSNATQIMINTNPAAPKNEVVYGSNMQM